MLEIALDFRKRHSRKTKKRKIKKNILKKNLLLKYCENKMIDSEKGNWNNIIII